MIKRFTICALPVFILVLLFVGCLNIKTTIKVNKDGTGEIQQTFLISSTLSAMMNASANTSIDAGTQTADNNAEGDSGDTVNSGDEDNTDDSGYSGDEESTPDFSAQLMDAEKMRAQASKMGEGVVFVSSEPYEEGGFSGYKAKYSFNDINKLKINQNPAELMPMDTSGGDGAPSAEPELITFTFKKGTPAALTINMPVADTKADTKKSGDNKSAGMDEQTIAMMKEIYKDMKINMEVVVQGAITESNAVFKTSSAVTLIDIDFNKILADTKSFNALVKSEANSLEEMKALVKNVKGMKIELQPKVNVKFK